MKLRKGDVVEVITGEERGRRGKILRIELQKKSKSYRAIVEGINLAKKHQRTRGPDKPGGIVDLPNSINIANLVLICPKCGKRAKVKRVEHEGRRVRVCKVCEEIIDL